MSPIKSMIAMLFALGAASAPAQDKAALTPTPSKPADSATYGPVLNPQAAPAPAPTPPAAAQPSGEARPQAQEERAGQPPANKHLEVDPSARPAPQPAQPEPQGQQSQPAGQGQKGKPPARKGKQAVRRSVDQRIESTPRIAAPAPPLSPRVEARVTPAPVGPSSTQVVGCTGSACTDAAGAGYNAGGPGNTAVSAGGRLCTRSGATVQCF